MTRWTAAFNLEENFDLAVELYSKAIELDPKEPIYFSNRSMGYLKKELFGLALEDADSALKLDPTFVKAYFRRATANLALGKYKLASQDYERVLKYRPSDSDTKKKFEEVKKIIKRIAFEKAIAVDDPKSVGESIDLNSYIVEDSYDGPRLDDDITPKCKSCPLHIPVSFIV